MLSMVKIRALFFQTLATIAPGFASKLLYYRVFSKRINLSNPVLFNEKLMWLKLNTYYKNDIITQCADKYLVRKFVEDKGCGDSLNDFIGVWDRVEDIDWAKLPNQFVMKCNHGSGYNIICSDKEKLDIEDAKQKLSKWLNEDFWKKQVEINYRFVEKKIIAEKYMENEDGSALLDYKIYCFGGVPSLILIVSERETGMRLSFFDLDWKPLEIGAKPGDPYIKRPDTLNEMITLSEKLSKGFPFVRVDFYDNDNKAVFGEMTFTPMACVAEYYNDYGDKYLGEFVHLDI